MVSLSLLMLLQSTPEQQRVRVCRALDIKRKIDNFRNISCVVSLVHPAESFVDFHTSMHLSSPQISHFFALNLKTLLYMSHVLCAIIKTHVQGQ